MPCFDAQAAQERDDAVEALPSLLQMEAVLCNLTKKLGVDNIIDIVDWSVAGVTPQQYKDWAEKHASADLIAAVAAKEKAKEASQYLIISSVSLAHFRDYEDIFKDRQEFESVCREMIERYSGLHKCFGELMRPGGWNRHNILAIDPLHVAFRVDNLQFVNGEMLGDIAVLNTTGGMTVRRLYKEDRRSILFTPRLIGCGNGKKGIVTIDARPRK